MDIQNLDSILGRFGNDEAWQEQRLFQMLRGRWESVVGETVAAHSRPTGVHHRVLQVATSGAVWSQNLTFERRRILQKIQRVAPLRSLELKDIRFSTADWHNRAIALSDRLGTQEQERLWQAHPSRLGATETLCPCPQCQSPTPPGELQRWSICAFCMAQQWRADQIKNQRSDTADAADRKS